ncbi:MAG: helix-turn-helix transcriptional regulator [Fervidicoccus sp.]
MRKKIIVLAFIIIFIYSITFISIAQEPSYTNAVISIDSYGIASIKQVIPVNDVSVVNCIGNCLYVLNINTSNVDYYLENNTIVLVPNNFTGNVLLEYISQLAYPNGTIWNVSFSSDINTTVVLPYGAILLSTYPLPIDFNVTSDGRLYFVYMPGNITLSYSYLQSANITNTTGFTSTTPSTAGLHQGISNYALYIIGIILIAIGLLIGYLYFRGPKKGKSLEEKIKYLDDRDRKIVEIIREKGPITPGDLLNQLNIPRSAFYRRINRLKKDGIIEQFEVGGKVYYKLKEGQ